MPSPFPGMDPYLERRTLWHSFHTLLIAELARGCRAVLPERYYVTVEQRAYLYLGDDPQEVQVPDLAVVRRFPGLVGAGKPAVGVLDAGVEVLLPSPEVLHQRYLEVRDLQENERVVTVLEVLSPSNKRPGSGRDDYIAKREDVLTSRTNLIEIDLLRIGPRLPAFGAPEGLDYSVLIARASTRPRARLIPFSVRDPFPEIPVPLHSDEPEPLLSLASVFAETYHTGSYGMRLPYRDEPDPPLTTEDAVWADALLRSVELR